MVHSDRQTGAFLPRGFAEHEPRGPDDALEHPRTCTEQNFENRKRRNCSGTSQSTVDVMHWHRFQLERRLRACETRYPLQRICEIDDGAGFLGLRCGAIAAEVGPSLRGAFNRRSQISVVAQ
jgi:hypothetical protein